MSLPTIQFLNTFSMKPFGFKWITEGEWYTSAFFLVQFDFLPLPWLGKNVLDKFLGKQTSTIDTHCQSYIYE